jgi:hypothetical protein
MLRYTRRLAFSLTWLARVRRFIVVHMSCGQVRGQCVEFSKKAKRNNGVCALRALRAAQSVLPPSAFRGFPWRPVTGGSAMIGWNDRGKQVRGYFTDFDARGNLDEGCRTDRSGRCTTDTPPSTRVGRVESESIIIDVPYIYRAFSPNRWPGALT